MSRQAIRDLKRAVRVGSLAGAGGDVHGLARESALALLARSVHFGHARLAVIRLAMAVKAGADVPSSHWNYCRMVVAGAKDPALHALFAEARSTWRPHHESTPWGTASPASRPARTTAAAPSARPTPHLPPSLT